MPKVIPKNVADEMTRPYIDDAVDRQLKAADVPPRNKLDISFKDTGRTDDNKDYESNQDAYEENHGKLYDMTHKNTVPWKNYVVYFVLLSLLTTVFTFSKYMSGANLSGDAVVAKFDYVITGQALGNNDILIKNNIWQPKEGAQTEFEFEEEMVFDFTVENKSDVTVDVMPQCLSKMADSNYQFSFYSDSKTETLISHNDSTNTDYMRIDANSSKHLYLLVDASEVTSDTPEQLKLIFDIVQVD